MRLPLIWPGNAAFLGCLGHPLRVFIVHSRMWTALSPDLFSERAAEAGTWSQRGIKNRLK